jgi:MarR family transcriptional regulator, organic hydroperoxide resistance regulator
MPKSNKGSLDSHYSKAEDSLGFLLWKAANLLQRSHADTLKPLAITPAQFSMMTCLVYLSAREEVTSALISQHAGMDKMMISDLVKTLAKKRLIRTKPNPRDGRSFLIEPTEQGIRQTNQAVRGIEKIDQKFFACVQGTSQLVKYLSQIVTSASV